MNCQAMLLLACIYAGIFISVNISPALATAPESDYTCGGNVEKQAWSIWDSTVKHHVSSQLIEKDLLAHGDTYALYNFQTYVHNLSAMAMRCDRRARINEISTLVSRTYAAMTTPSAVVGKRWICRGGSVCNSTNKLINTEVMLTSAQFLGLSTHLANWLATRPGQLTPEEALFVRETAEVTAEHLLRWGGEREGMTASRLKATVKEVKDGSSSYFYTDKDLWLLGIHADLAGILNSNFGKQDLVSLRDPRRQTLLKRYTEQLLQLFLKRLTLESSRTKEGTTVMTADLDRGFWRLFADNRYAGYTLAAKPVVCEKGPNDVPKLKVLVPQRNIPVVESLGWDISHARRLVHVLDPVSKNHVALVRAYDIPDSQLPGPKLVEAFANQLAVRVWNGDLDYPLFSNYLNGANGWYRVAYDNGTGQCREGTPPYGLSISFPTGGYATWGKQVPVLGTFGRKIHELLGRSDERSVTFIDTYYAGFGRKASSLKKALNNIMFLPSLVGNSP